MMAKLLVQGHLTLRTETMLCSMLHYTEEEYIA